MPNSAKCKLVRPTWTQQPQFSIREFGAVGDWVEAPWKNSGALSRPLLTPAPARQLKESPKNIQLLRNEFGPERCGRGITGCSGS